MTERILKYSSFQPLKSKEYYKGREIIHLRDFDGTILKTFYKDDLTEVVYDNDDKSEK